MTWRERIGYEEGEEFFPLPIAAAIYCLGVAIRKVWLYACAPLGFIALLIGCAQLALGALGLGVHSERDTDTRALIRLLTAD